MKPIKHLVIAFAVVAGMTTTASAQTVSDKKPTEFHCTGSNLLPQMKKEAPVIAANLAKEAAAMPYGKGLTWKIEKDGIEPSYLFGTMHLSDPRMLTLKPGSQTAFDNASTVALEITEILDPIIMAQKAISLLQYTLYTDGQTLDTRLKKEDAALVKTKVAQKLGLPWNVASRMRPWALMGSLALPACELARKNAQKPFLDMKLGRDAKAAGKTLVGLETLESQMKAMASLPEGFAVQGLVQSVRLGNRMDDLFETMIQLYQKEDVATIWSMMKRIGTTGFVKAQENANYAAFQRIIVDARNVSMVDAAEGLLNKGGAFIAVGALHLPGESGIANILAKKGYRVTRVQP